MEEEESLNERIKEQISKLTSFSNFTNKFSFEIARQI